MSDKSDLTCQTTGQMETGAIKRVIYVCSECSYICVFTQGFNFVFVSTIFFIRILNCSDSGIILWREKSSLPMFCKWGEPCLFIILFMLKSAYKLHTIYINTFTIDLDFFSAVGLGSWCFHMTLLYSMQVQLKIEKKYQIMHC
jgi:hypothetical protein